jgi:hypothetical protein
MSEEGVKMQAVRMKVAPDTVAYADGEHHTSVDTQNRQLIDTSKPAIS